MYKKVWEPVLNEELRCELEPNNEFDKNAVSVVKCDQIVGHIPRELKSVCVLHSERWQD